MTKKIALFAVIWAFGALAEPQTPIAQTNLDQATPADKERIAEHLTRCLNDWDLATHMTKKEWARVCRRVVEGRAKFRLSKGLVIPDPR